MKATVHAKFLSSHLPPQSHLIQDFHRHQTLLQRMKESSLDRKRIQKYKTVQIFLMIYWRNSEASQERFVGVFIQTN